MKLKIRWRKVVGGVLLGLVFLFLAGLMVVTMGLQGALVVTGISILLTAVVALATYLLSH